jgi:hypothetical protein
VFTEYITKQGDTLVVGDTLIIGVPTSDLGFVFISQGGLKVANKLSGNKVMINKFKTYGTKKQGFKVYALFGGYGLYPCLIDYETALEVGEIKNKNAKITSDEALKELKKWKTKYDLELISKDEYDAKKTELSKLIK